MVFFSLKETTSMITILVVLCICRSNAELFPDTCFPKCSWVHVVISIIELCWLLMQCHLGDWRTQGFTVGLRPRPLHAVVSPDSLNLLMILWTVDAKINCTLRNLTIFPQFFRERWTSCNSCLSKTEPFEDASLSFYCFQTECQKGSEKLHILFFHV